MNLLTLVISYLKAKPLNTLLNILLLALGIAVITILLLFNHQLREKISDNTKGIDLVVGAKGSPLQLILCNVFHIDFPTGNINLKEAERLAKHRLVKSAIPLALGDSYQSFRIVGTNLSYAELYQAELANGTWWSADLEVVVGATTAELLQLKEGDTFESAHGLSKEGHAHDENPFVVTGVLKKTNSVVDNLILTNVSSIWKVHAEHDSIETVSNKIISDTSVLVPTHEAGDSTKEITSLLIKYRNPIAAIQLPRYINAYTPMQVASPAFEAARLFSILGVGVEALTGFSYVLILISALSIFIALYNSLKERQYDLAIMRSMGASRAKLFIATQLEGVTLTVLGSLLGLALGHLVLFAFTSLVAESQKTGMSAFVFYSEELYLFIGSLVLGIVCSLIPSVQAYRTDIHNVLAGR
ncbi:MAG: ABC transporter permease [Cyclobacteriaceae bacterium]|nr:ABC transporter permease [Cyclobacteriaceae bacterium]